MASEAEIIRSDSQEGSTGSSVVFDSDGSESHKSCESDLLWCRWNEYCADLAKLTAQRSAAKPGEKVILDLC